MFRRFKRCACGLVVLASWLAVDRLEAAEPVTLETLLNEVVDRDALARWPEPSYVSKQASSYDRRSKTPADPAGWFANGDNMDSMGEAPKWEDHQGRKECVMMDADGPGVVTRFWTGGEKPRGTVRFYLDGAESPAFEGPLYELLGGRGIVPPPLAITNSGDAGNLYLPVPFAKHCKITYDDGTPPGPPRGRWYNIEYRVYPSGTTVEPFTMERFKKLAPLVQKVAKTLAEPADLAGGQAIAGDWQLDEGKEASLELPAGSRAVRQLSVRLEGVTQVNIEEIVRGVVLRASFDGQEMIWCPLGDFFGSGVGLRPVKNWTRTVDGEGAMICRWVMPYQKSAKLSLLNLSPYKLGVKLSANTSDWKWDDRSMYFHTTWRRQWPIATRPFSDWNFLEATGRGVYVGDTLCVWNPNNKWWGEGDEKVWVDGESFPSHFGTGSEDHYGYAWGNPAPFQGPFCNQPRAEPGNIGHTTNTRTRVLDAIPFTKSLKYDFEIWHWANCKVAYCVASYWYAPAGTTCNRATQPEEAAAHPTPTAVRIRGAIEVETMKVVAQSEGVKLSTQVGRYSGNAQLFVQANKPGDFVEVLVAENVDGLRKLTLHATKSYDYGTLRFSSGGKPLKDPWDGYSPQVTLSEPIDLGAVEPVDGKVILRVEVVGGNEAARGTKAYFGLDCVTLEKP